MRLLCEFATLSKALNRTAAVIAAALAVALLWAAGDTLSTFADVAGRNILTFTFSLLLVVLLSGGLFYMAYTLWIMEGVPGRLRFLSSYCLSVLLFLGFLMPIGDQAWVAILLISYVPVTVVAFIFPLRYCTVLKGLALAGIGALIPFVLGYGLDLFARLTHGT